MFPWAHTGASPGCGRRVTGPQGPTRPRDRIPGADRLVSLSRRSGLPFVPAALRVPSSVRLSSASSSTFSPPLSVAPEQSDFGNPSFSPPPTAALLLREPMFPKLPVWAFCEYIHVKEQNVMMPCFHSFFSSFTPKAKLCGQMFLKNSFIEVWLGYNQLHVFKVNNLIRFRHQNQDKDPAPPPVPKQPLRCFCPFNLVFDSIWKSFV